MRGTTNPQYITVHLATPGSVLRGGTLTLNLEHYDPEQAVMTKRGLELRLRTNQKITVLENKEQLDAALTRYLELKAAQEGV